MARCSLCSLDRTLTNEHIWSRSLIALFEEEAPRRYSVHSPAYPPGVDSAVWGFVGVVVGGLITGLVSIRLETIRADKAAALDSATREDDRRWARDTFQRETLLSLQDALGGLARAAVVLHRLNMARVASGAKLVTVTDSQYDAEMDARRRVASISANVEDDETRSLASQLIDTAFRASHETEKATAARALLDMGDLERRLALRTGELVRSTFRV